MQAKLGVEHRCTAALFHSHDWTCRSNLCVRAEMSLYVDCGIDGRDGSRRLRQSYGRCKTVNSKAYIPYLILTMLAPNFLALVNYLVTGKIAEEQQLKGRFLSARSIAGTFFAIDWICIIVQGAGSGILASALQSTGTAVASAITRGKTVVVIGLSIQLFFFASFAMVAGKCTSMLQCCAYTRAVAAIVSF